MFTLVLPDNHNDDMPIPGRPTTSHYYIIFILLVNCLSERNLSVWRQIIKKCHNCTFAAKSILLLTCLVIVRGSSDMISSILVVYWNPPPTPSPLPSDHQKSSFGVPPHPTIQMHLLAYTPQHPHSDDIIYAWPLTMQGMQRRE